MNTNYNAIQEMLREEYSKAVDRQTLANRPSGFMRGLDCAIAVVSMVEEQEQAKNYYCTFSPSKGEIEYIQRDTEMTNQLLEVIRPRGNGKTVRMLFESYKTGATIVCPSQHMCDHVRKMARDFGIEIPTPITFDQMIHQRGKDPNNEYLVDELISCVQSLTSNRIVGYTHTPPLPLEMFVIRYNEELLSSETYTSFHAAQDVCRKRFNGQCPQKPLEPYKITRYKYVEIIPLTVKTS